MEFAPVEEGASALTADEIAELLPQLSEWEIGEKDGIQRLQRRFAFADFAQALAFTVRVGQLAEAKGHHPVILTAWGMVTVIWWTHKVKGLHQNDFLMAAMTGALFSAGSA
jgi:4a-hydroxytetrahydrobiopterin dehydratase